MRGTFKIGAAERRRAFRLGYLNGALWAIGNGLTTGALVTYLALDLGAKGLGLSLILAAPALVGALRLAAPPLIARLGTAKRATLLFSLASYTLVWALPLAGVAHALDPRARLVALIALLSAHQLLEYIAQVALWSWLADVVPRPLRGRYFANRQILQLLVLIPTLIASGWFTDSWTEAHARSSPEYLLGYAIPNAVGALFLLASLAPLVWMPATPPLARSERPLRLVFAALRDGRFRRLLAYGCWFSFFNGVTQAPQGIFPKAILKFGVTQLSLMRIAMQVGQIGVAAWAGRFSDRFGNRPALVLSQLVLATAPAFMLLATPAERWWFAGAWIAWSAYAGLNIGLPNLMLKLAGRDEAPSYIAVYFAVTSLFYAGSTVAGGYAFDRLGQWSGEWPLSLDRFQLAFAVALAGRSLAVLFLLRLEEPGAWSWSEILFRRREKSALPE